MTELPQVTLICVDCYHYGDAVSAIQKSLKQIKPAAAKFLTDIDIELDGIEVVKIPRINSKEEYSRFIVKKLYNYFITTHVLVIQHDGYVLNGDIWDNSFRNYDYIGAPWLESDGYNVGNGGFSLRSWELQEVLAHDESISATHPEDAAICRTYRNYLETKYDITFAPAELADKFSFELRQPNQPTFGFHGRFHQPYRPTVIVKRDAALGDCIIMEPLLRYYAIKGYNVVVDIPIGYYALYKDHYFPVQHISQFDRGRIKEEKFINLNSAYEVKPRQNYLKSYFQFAGITDYTLTRPQLYPIVNNVTKLFKAYAVIHIDDRDTPHRNTYGVNWTAVRKHLEFIGLTVIQIGANDSQDAGTRINTPDLGLLKFVIAGCDIFIGVDSGPAGMAVAFNKPCVLLFGSVNPEYIHPDLKDVEIVQGGCDKAYCWHIEGGVAGQPCAYLGTNKEHQCCHHETADVIDAINKLNYK